MFKYLKLLNIIVHRKANLTTLSRLSFSRLKGVSCAGNCNLSNKAYGIYQDHIDGYVICGHRFDYFEDPSHFDFSRGWICKIDENGDSIWWREYKHFTDPEWHKNYLYDMHLTSDGGYIAIGQTATYNDPQQTDRKSVV